MKNNLHLSSQDFPTVSSVSGPSFHCFGAGNDDEKSVLDEIPDAYPNNTHSHDGVNHSRDYDFRNNFNNNLNEDINYNPSYSPNDDLGSKLSEEGDYDIELVLKKTKKWEFSKLETNQHRSDKKIMVFTLFIQILKGMRWKKGRKERKKQQKERERNKERKEQEKSQNESILSNIAIY